VPRELGEADGLKLGKRDVMIIFIISAFFFLIAAFNLGQLNIPSTNWQVQPDSVTMNFDSNRTISTVYLLVNTDSNVTASFSTPRGADWTAKAYMNNYGYYKWIEVPLNVKTDRLRIRFYTSAGDLFEVVAVDSNQEQVGIRSIKSDSGDASVLRLVDEQSLFENPPSFRSESFFDEDLFVRAAKEYLSLKEPVSEETHPPLGKLIIAASIDAFSFNPFSWRIMGVVFATMMIPVIYALGLALFKTRAAATIAASLLSLDFMHFSMSRVGTVDTYLVFFILLSTLFFYLNYEKMSRGSGPDFRFILMGVIFFSLAFSVKWIAVFSLLGEAILFLTIWMLGPSQSESLTERLNSLIKPLLVITVIILIVGGGIYLASFIPYALIGHSLYDIYNAQWSMLAYHTEMSAYTHQNSSNWWQWPTILVPLWLYIKELPGGMISIISAMGNPVVWWTGLIAVISATVDGAKRKWPYLFLGILYFSQLLPYALISRYLFIYHYYAEVPILCLAIAGLVHEMWYKPQQKKYVIILIVATCIMFAIFYPVISGYPIPQWYDSYLRWFRGWTF
jgi:dolichyl-phosphate-mannose--protein O-mannosyl transferase